MLLRPIFALCIENLRKLWVQPKLEYGIPLIASAAANLEEICFDCDYLDVANLNAPSLPPFPCLRFVSFLMNFRHCDTPWFVETVCSLLTSPADEITITTASFKGFPVFSLSAATMTTLNGMFHSDRPNVPRLRWQLDLLDDAGDWTPWKDFMAALEQGIPMARERGKLIVEKQDMRGMWPGGTLILHEQ
ncbi:hypothetical protein B0H11DRAFT_1979794 [Mycena galericulata]|nr:hypothetical protein B0H11DRAFT_1979794 [Mycena galericulata]